MSLKVIPESRALEASAGASIPDPAAGHSLDHREFDPREIGPQQMDGRSPARHEVGRPGPFQIVSVRPDVTSSTSVVSSLVGEPSAPPRRRYSCTHYEDCLDLAAALDWDNFTCRGCSGEIDESLFWRARQMNRRDPLVKTICEIPAITQIAEKDTGESIVTPAVAKIVGQSFE